MYRVTSRKIRAITVYGMNEPYGKKDWDCLVDLCTCSSGVWEWMSLMEKRIETTESLWQPSIIASNEWALWKKGLRPGTWPPVTIVISLRMNEPYGKKDWDSIGTSFSTAAHNRMNEPYGKKDWDDNSVYIKVLWVGNWNEWALWKKGLRLYQRVRPIFKKRLNEWALWKKGLRRDRNFFVHHSP